MLISSFIFNGTLIENPLLDETGIYDIDPSIYYQKAFEGKYLWIVTQNEHGAVTSAGPTTPERLKHIKYDRSFVQHLLIREGDGLPYYSNS